MQPSPFEQLLGDAFGRLPAPVRHVHGLHAPLRTAGRADVTAATGVLARLLCWQAGLPKPGQMNVSVLFTPDGNGGEHWDRMFGDRRYASTIFLGSGARRGFLIEHFGLFHLSFRLTIEPEGLVWTLAGWRLLGIPLPRWTVPVIRCVEGADGERFTFDIDVTFPLIGWVIRYRGWLVPAETAQPAD